MNYQDTWSWPNIPVEPVSRDDIETLYSFGHYDGVGTGLIRWQGKLWWAERFEIHSDRYWIIELDEDHGQRLLERGREWARLFSSAMSWQPNGQRAPKADGIYCCDFPFAYGDDVEYIRRKTFYAEWSRVNRLEEPPKDAEVVGYFEGWRA